MKHRMNVIAALMALNLSSAGAETDPVTVDHSQHTVTTNKRNDVKPRKKTVTTPTKTAVDMSAMPGMDHSGMDHSKMDHSKMNHESMSPSAVTGAAQHAGHAMNHGGGAAMSMQGGSAPPDARDPHAYSDGYDFGPIPHPQMGDEEKFGALVVDRLESVTTHGSTSMTYDWQAWYGQTSDRAVIRAEGDIDGGRFKDARNELLWAHAVSAYWDTQLGVRYDSGQGSNHTWLAFGVQGLAPYWIYVEATAYVNEQGRTAFRLETEYDLLLTQKLILQPRVEMNFYSQRDDTRAVSSGLSDFSGGLRLRYEIRREFAPYVGVEWASKFGSAADNLQAAGLYAAGMRLVAGVHFWY